MASASITKTGHRMRGPQKHLEWQTDVGLVDMEPMTDAFLTASVLAAIASLPPKEGRTLSDGSRPTTTRIIGIANQRVKECNRIQAMIDQLGTSVTVYGSEYFSLVSSQVWD